MGPATRIQNGGLRDFLRLLAADPAGFGAAEKLVFLHPHAARELDKNLALAGVPHIWRTVPKLFTVLGSSKIFIEISKNRSSEEQFQQCSPFGNLQNFIDVY